MEKYRLDSFRKIIKVFFGFKKWAKFMVSKTYEQRKYIIIFEGW